MNKLRWLYGFLFSFWAAAGAFVVVFYLVGGGVGFLWIYVYGDDPWPAWTDHLIPIASGAMLLSIGAAAIYGFFCGFRIGSREDAVNDFPRKYRRALWGLAGTVLVILIVNVLMIGNFLSRKSDETNRQRKAQLKELVNSGAHRVKQLQFERAGGDLRIKVVSEGILEGRYEVILYLTGIYGEYYRERWEAAVVGRGNEFERVINLKDVGDGLRRKLEGKITTWASSVGVEETLEIRAAMRFLEGAGFSRDDTQAMELVGPHAKVDLKAVFLCDRAGCRTEEEIHP